MGVACGHSKVDYTQHAQRHGGKGPVEGKGRREWALPGMWNPGVNLTANIKKLSHS